MDRWGIAGQGIEAIYSGKLHNVPDVSRPDVEPSRNDPKFNDLDRIGSQHRAQEVQVKPSGVVKPMKSSRTYIIDRQDVMEILAKKKKDQDENADAAEMSSSGNAKPSKRLLKRLQTRQKLEAIEEAIFDPRKQMQIDEDCKKHAHE
eukprot:gene11672-12882_t